MKYFKKLEGDRVYLSPMNIEDIEQYVKWMNDFQVTDGLGTSHLITSLISEKEWIEKASSPDQIQFSIILKEKDRLIGNCGFPQVNHIKKIGEVGLFIGDEEYRNKGYGTEALKLLIAFGFDYLTLNNIMLRVASFNDRAIKSYKKVGFKEFGRRTNSFPLKGKLHDDIYMEYIKEDYYKK